jgi:hypothetical protein
MANFIEYEFEGEDKIMLALEHHERRGNEFVKQMLNNLADFGHHVLQSHVPRHSTYLLRHVDKEPARWRPGGAGGGGSYEAVVGIKRGTSKHPLYVEFGTGLYGGVGWYILPRTHPYMTFYSTRYHRWIRAKYTKGQRPQHYMYATWREMLIYARGRAMAGGILR